MKMIITIFTAASLLFFTSCKKEKNEIQPGDTGELVVEFDNVVGVQNLQLNTGTYTNAVGESFKITMLNYYISNISVITTSGTKYTLPKDSSYFLVKEEDAATHKIRLQNIAACANYQVPVQQYLANGKGKSLNRLMLYVSFSL